MKNAGQTVASWRKSPRLPESPVSIASFTRRALYALALLALASAAFYGLFSAVAYRWNWDGVWRYRQQFGYG